MIFSDIKVKIIEDSRKNKTLEAFVVTQDGKKEVLAQASVPSGKSTGVHEVKSIDSKLALDKLEKIKSQIIGINFDSQQEFDRLLIEIDGTSDKHNLGGNLILALSLACSRAFAQIKGLELNQYLHQIFEIKPESKNQFPRPLFNVINGGAHVTIPLGWKKKFGISKSLDIQEFQVVPTTDDFALGLSIGREFYHKLGKSLEKIYGKDGVILGDEAGYVCPFKTNEEALEILQELINKHLYPLKIGLDAAASQFYNDENNSYLIEDSQTTPEELEMLYYNIVHAYELISLEDPFDEESFDYFSKLTADLCGSKMDERKKNGIGHDFLVITDDLTTTNPERLSKAISKKSANAILIKPNQIGTLTETLEVAAMAYKNGWQAVISHRSGETKDDFIADLAVGIGAWGLKSGAPATDFRMAKYLRALELWQKLHPVDILSR